MLKKFAPLAVGILVAASMPGVITAQAQCPKIGYLFYSSNIKDMLKGMQWYEKQCPGALGPLSQRPEFRTREAIIAYYDAHPVEYLIVVYEFGGAFEMLSPTEVVQGDVNATVYGSRTYRYTGHRYIVYRHNLNGPVVAASNERIRTRGPAAEFKLAVREALKDAHKQPRQ